MSQQQYSPEDLSHLRHSCAHLLAAAVIELWPGTKRTIGPAIEDGFYYDFEFAKAISETDLPQIEKKMQEILKTWKSFERSEVNKAQALETFKDNKYKQELIEEFAEEGQTLTLYTSGSFTDLCRGGHTENPSEAMQHFKLLSVAGAYWRGNENNTMLTRIYGTCFPSQIELDAYLTMMAEAEKRDHRKLGKELKLFTISEYIGSGLPLFQPNGMIVRKAIEDYLWSLHAQKGYQRVWTPHIAKEQLYEISGHASKFGDELFRVQGKEEKFFLKPMNCPHHMQIFCDNQWSYRDMPIRYFEPATVYRDEKSGQLSGLTRVRSITQDDGHLFCRVSQIDQEVSTIVNIIKEFYTVMGMMDGYWVRLSVRGKDGMYLGTDEVWETAEKALEEAAEKNNLPYKRVEGEAAFYGPKLDFIFKDAIGRPWQLATIQCDFNLPERFDLSFVNEKGEKERPVVIHRAISGSLERFIGVLIEHFAGKFPLWLAPVQIAFVPVVEKHQEFCQKLAEEFQALGIRTHIDTSNDTLGKKIRNASMKKYPYTLVIGDKEMENPDLQVRILGNDTVRSFSKAEFTTFLTKKIQTKEISYE